MGLKPLRWILCAALGACTSSQPDNVANSQASQPVLSTGGNRATAPQGDDPSFDKRRTTSGFDALRSDTASAFGWAMLDADGPDNPLWRVQREWIDRFRACGTAACRRSALAEPTRRLRFGLGRSRDRFDGIPWPIGHYEVHWEGGSRQVSILPLEGQLIVLRIDTLRQGRDCQLVAVGRVGANGQAIMRSLGGVGRFLLRTRNPAEIEITALTPEPDLDVCHGEIFGRYPASDRLIES